MSSIPFKLLAASMMLIAGLGTGATLLTHRTLVAGPREANQEPISQVVPKAKPKEDEEMLQGTWHIVEVEVGGKHQANDTSKDQIWVFTRDRLAIKYDDGSSLEMTYQLDPKQKPRAIDLSPTDEREQGYTFKGIYELDGDRLKLYYSRNVASEAARPTRFDPESEDRGKRFYVLKRAPAAFTAWGKEVGGLQAGLGFPAGQKRAYAQGETVKLVVRVRNVGKEAVKFQYLREFFLETPPTVTDGKGKPVHLGQIEVSGLIHLPVDVNLAPGKEIVLTGSQPFYELVLKLKPEGLDGTGMFQIQYERVFGNTGAGKIEIDPTLSKLATGILELEVIKPLAPENKPAPKDLGKIQPPGGVPLPLVKPGTNAIGVDQLNKVRARLEAVPADDLEKWVVELERILDGKLKEGVPSARQVCRTDFAIHMSVAFDDLKWNAKTADNLYKRAQTMPASEAKVWKEAFEALLKKEIGQTDTTNLAGGPAWAVPLVLIPVDALHQGQKYSAERGMKYRARLKQLTAEDVSLWKDKVDEFGGTKLDAAVNIILLEDYFDRETFQRDRFKAAIEARKKGSPPFWGELIL